MALAAGVIAVRIWAPVAFEPRAAIEWLTAMSPLAQVAAFVAAYAVLTTVAVPAFVLHVAAGVAFGFERGLPIALLAANLASNAQFFVGRWLGSERLSAWLERKGFRRRFEENSIAAIVVLRTIPSPFLAVNVGCGAAGVPWRTFVVGSGLGLISVTTAHVFFAAQLYAGVEGAKVEALGWAVLGGAVVVAFAVVPKWLRNRKAPRP